MALTPQFTVVFDRDSESATFGKFILTDTTDYVGNGVALADVVGYFVINFPSGIYTGSFSSPDIDPNVSLTNNVISLPLDSYGEVQKGTYSFQYFIEVTGAVLPGIYQSTKLSFDANIPFCAIPSQVVISASTDCFQGILTATNATNYGVFSATREMTVYPPQSLSLPNFVVASNTLTYNFQFDNVSYQIGVNDLLTYTLGVFTVTYRATGMLLQPINCDINLCRLRSCLNKFLTSIENKAKQVGGYSKLPTSVLNEQNNLFGLYIKFQNSIECSKYDEATKYYNQISEIVSAGGCNCGCSDNDEPSPFVPISQVNNTVLVQGGTGITVTSVTVGTTTTYTVTLSNGYQTIITNLQSDVTTLQGDVATLQSDVATLQGQVAAIDSLNQVVYETGALAVPATDTWTTTATYAAASGSLEVGSELELSANFYFANANDGRDLRIRINTVEVIVFADASVKAMVGVFMSAKLKLQVLTATTASYQATLSIVNTNLVEQFKTILSPSIGTFSINNIASLSNTIDVQAKQSVGGTLSQLNANVKQFNKV
jgi:hypothetical protein